MKATLLDGSVQEIRPGTNLCGERILSIELDMDDFADERIYDWLKEVVYTRFVPKVSLEVSWNEFVKNYG